MLIPEYHPTYAARARDLRYVGLKDKEIAELLGVKLPVLEEWRKTYPEFDYAWKEGGSHADANVAKSLYKRACGYTTTKKKETKDGFFTEEVHVPADVSACIFWLTNRQPEHWHQKVEHTGTVGVTPMDSMTELEVARRVAFALAKAMNAEEPRRIEDGTVTADTPKTE